MQRKRYVDTAKLAIPIAGLLALALVAAMRDRPWVAAGAVFAVLVFGIPGFLALRKLVKGHEVDQ